MADAGETWQEVAWGRGSLSHAASPHPLTSGRVDSGVIPYLVNARPGIRFRVRTKFTGDADHLGGTSPWAHFPVTS